MALSSTPLQLGAGAFTSISGLGQLRRRSPSFSYPPSDECLISLIDNDFIRLIGSEASYISVPSCLYSWRYLLAAPSILGTVVKSSVYSAAPVFCGCSLEFSKRRLCSHHVQIRSSHTYLSQIGRCASSLLKRQPQTRFPMFQFISPLYTSNPPTVHLLCNLESISFPLSPFSWPQSLRMVF